MALFSVQVFCSECSQTHPMVIAMELSDISTDRTSIGDAYAGKSLPQDVLRLTDNGVQCPVTGRMFKQKDNQQVFLVATGRTHARRNFENTTVILDGDTFIECTFKNSQLVYRGESVVRTVGCTFGEGCTWQFEGPAERALKCLSALYKDGAKQLVESIFDEIRGTK